MFVITIASQKGGTGKSTLSCALAVAAEQAGLDTVLVDLDPQASAAKWADLRADEKPIVTTAQAPRLERILDAAREGGAELVIIDTAPHAADAALAASRCADLVLIPCRPSAPDLDAVGATIDIARIADRPAVALINAAPVRNPLVEQAREAFEGYSTECAPVTVHQRITHVHAWTQGRTAAEIAPRAKAAIEISELFNWIRNRGGDRGQT